MTTNESTIEGADVVLVKQDDIVEGTVVAIQKAALYVDLGLSGTGIIYGAEFMNARDVIKRINIGDMISAKVILRENKEGYVELSLKEARQALMWSDAEQAIKEKRVMDLVIKDANKGGLIIEWQGIAGFLPASQLKEENYPRVEDGDKDKILRELKKLIGKRISVTIINALPKEGKLIFSEKDGGVKESKEVIAGKESISWAMGVEGYSFTYYFVPLRLNKTLVITEYHYYDSYSPIVTYPTIAQFDEIISTLKLY